MTGHSAACLALVSLLAVLPVSAAPFHEIETVPEKKIADGWQDYTVRFKPSENAVYDDLVFECVYRQEFPWKNADGEETIKIHKPGTFIYRRHDVKIVADLDCFVSFKVPAGLARLRTIFGDNAVRPGIPATLHVIRVSGLLDGKPVWKIELPPSGVFVPKE